MKQYKMRWQWQQLDHMQMIRTYFRQITTPTPHHSIFTGLMPLLLPNQQCRSTEGITEQYHTAMLIPID